MAFRSVFPLSHLSHIPDVPEEAEHIWAPDRTLFVSRLGGDLFTVVASHQSDPGAPGVPYSDATWDSTGDVGVIRELYRDWHPRYRAIVDATPWTGVYPNSAAHAGRTPARPAAEDIARALRIYERTRKAHTDRVMSVVHEQNKKKVERLGQVQTDEELRARLRNRYDPSWIHEHEVQLAFSQALDSLAN